MSDKYKDITDRSDNDSDNKCNQLDFERPVRKITKSMAEIVINLSEYEKLMIALLLKRTGHYIKRLNP